MARKLLANELLQAAAKSGLSLTIGEAASLASGQSLEVRPEQASTVGTCAGLGLKIADLGDGCALYLNPFALPPKVTVCCGTEGSSEVP